MSTILEKAEKYYQSLRKKLPKEDIEAVYGVGYIDGLRSAQNEIKRLQEILKTKTIKYQAYTPYLSTKENNHPKPTSAGVTKELQEKFDLYGSFRCKNS